MGSLYEAIALVVIVALIGFWDWRAALLMAVSIPLTLAMTFGVMQLLGIDLQQVSIATLIIALGLLVDMPVVAGDAIKRELAQGSPRELAAWLGPTKLATAILFATITNIVAYLPFLILTGDIGLLPLQPAGGDDLLAGRVARGVDHLHAAARYYLHQAAEEPEPPMSRAPLAWLRRVLLPRRCFALRHRWAVFVGSLAILGVRRYFMSASEAAVLPQGPVVPLLRRRLAAAGCAARRDQCGRRARRSGDP